MNGSVNVRESTEFNQTWNLEVGLNLTEIGNGTQYLDLASLLGARRQALGKVIPITVIYCVIFITGIVGNVSTCIVIARNSYMQTATNYYLFNLAIADLLVLVLGLPQETYSFWSAYPWRFGETFCVLRSMAAETSTYASILTITAFTVERYVAICYPMKAQAMSSLQRAIKAIVLIWIVSGICSIPIVVQYGVVYIQDPRTGHDMTESATCRIRPDRYLRHAFEVSTFLFFITPMTIISVLYALIGLAVRRSTLSRTNSDTSAHSGQTGSEGASKQKAKARRAVLSMLVAVVVAFFICWAPFHAQRLLVIYLKDEDWTERLITLQSVLYYASGILYYVSSVINPILYNIMSLKFRQAFINTISRPCRRRKKRKKLKTYRFQSRNPGTDTNLTLMQLNLNGYTAKLGVHKGHLGCHKYTHGARSNSSSYGSSSPRYCLAPLKEGCDLFDEICIQGDLNTCQSLPYHRPASSGNNTSHRPSHSLA